jgi:hypothetical protein
MPALGAVSSLVTSGAVGVASGLATAVGDRSRMLPVHPDIAELFPRGGLRRGSTVAVLGSTSLLFTLLARATETGSWAAVVGMPDLGLRAAAELGVAVERLALVRHPGADLPKVVAALLDGMDLVAVDPARLTDAQIRRLSARARHRGSVLVPTGAWPGADLELTQESATWSGLGEGHGHLAVRDARLSVRGRGAAARPAEARLRFPQSEPESDPAAASDASNGPLGALPAPRGSFEACGADWPEPCPPTTPEPAHAPKDAFGALNAPKDAFGASNAPNDALGALPGPGTGWSEPCPPVVASAG